MASKSTVMNLKIELSPSQVAPVEKWISRFVALEKNWVDYPCLKGNILHISAICFPFFMAYVDVSESNEFDVKRLHAMGKTSIKRLLTIKQTSTAIRYYQQALDNLETIKIGEFFMENPEAAKGRDVVV